jgi:hypothetical protein
MDAGYRLVERLGMPRLVARSGGQILADSTPAVGDTLTIRVPDGSSDDLCENFTTIQARTAYSGERAVVLEDVNAPLAGTMDDFFAQVGGEYDTVMHPVLTANFGDPLAVDPQTDANGHIFMVFSPVVNEVEGIAGFIFPGDFFPRSSCAQSNGGEVFYARVPTDSGDGVRNPGTRENWFWAYRSTVVHEVKHIVSYAERLGGGATVFEDRWLEEASARLAEEFWAREVFGYGQNDNTDYSSSLHCEIRPDTGACAGMPLGMFSHFDALYNYVAGPNLLSLLGPVRSGDFSFYGSGWSLLRWAIDHFADDESAFVRALVQETDLAGIDNLEARTGRSFPELLGEWELSLFMDDNGVATAARLGQPSWNLADIFAGMNRDRPAWYPDPRPFGNADASFGNFAIDVNELRGGSVAFFLIDGTQSAEQLLELQSPGGGDPPASLRLAIVRIRE